RRPRRPAAGACARRPPPDGRLVQSVSRAPLTSEPGQRRSMKLPIDAVLGDLLAALRDGTRALLIAPPGAGKTTRVAPALLGEDWCVGQVLLLVPRRLAARAAAEFMAAELGEKPGETIGYATRLDSKVGKATRVIAMTHGVFL